MSTFILTGAMSQFNPTSTLKIPADSSATCLVTLTFVGTVAFPATISANATIASADAISWTQTVAPIVVPGPTLSFTVTADASPVLQPQDVIQQNYLVTVTDSTGRTGVINIAVGNIPGYPAAELLTPPGYPDAVAFATTPSQPTGLVAAPLSSTLIELTWNTPFTPGSLPITGYQIQRESPIGSGFVILDDNTGTTNTVYEDFTVVPNTTYNYQVAAISKIGLGAFSNPSIASTPNIVASAPLNLITAAFSSTQIDLSWNPPLNPGTTPIVGYQISRETPTGTGFNIIVANTGSVLTTYSDTGLTPNTSYNYKVAAVNGGGVGLESNASASTTPP